MVSQKNRAGRTTGRIVIWALLVILTIGGRANGSEPEIGRIDVVLDGVAGDTASWEAIARAVIPIQAGEVFSADRLAAALAALRTSGLFSDIHVPDPDWDVRPFSLTFHLTPFPRIRNIRIHRAFPLLEREILSAIGFSVGGPFNKAQIPPSETAVKALYRDQGFINPNAAITARGETSEDEVVLDVHIDKGAYYRIRGITLEGNRSFSNTRLLARLGTWQASWLPGSPGRFSDPRLEKDVQNLTAFYRRQGFPDVALAREVIEDPQSRSVDVRLRITEGPKYEIDFDGNDAFWDRTLRKDVVLFTEGNPGGLGIRKSVRNIRERYQSAGYGEVDVTADIETATSDGMPVRHVRFRIDEGLKDVVDTITIDGNSSLADATIRKALILRPPGILADGPYTPELLSADKQAIRALYLKEGFPETHITETLKPQEPEADGERKVSVDFNIAEGPRIRVADVRIDGLTVLSETEARDALSLQAGAVFREYMVRSDENALATAISERGYPHVSVTGVTRSRQDGRSVDLVYTVVEGPFVRMGEVHILGNDRTRPAVIQDEMALRTGDPFSLSKMLQSQRNIRSLNAVDRVKFATPGLAEQDQEVHLLVELEEKKPYFFQFGMGFDTDRRLYANGKIGDHNLLGLNKDAWIGAELSEIGYMAELNVTEPRFLGTRISATAGLSMEEREDFNQDFGVRSLASSLTFRRRLGESWNSSLGFRLERREQYLTDRSPDDVDEADIFDPRAILVTTPAVTYNSTDSFSRPQKGALVQASVDMSTGLQNSFDDFLKYRLDARWYATPLERLTFALRGRVGIIDPLSDQSTVPEDQLFFLGGLGSVRGFDKNELRLDDEGDAVGGRTEILGSVEARIGLWGSVEGVTFYDVGSIQSAPSEDGSNRFRSSVGLGLRYVTPIGPVGIVYGYKLDRDPGESAGAWHFSIGYSF